MAKEKEVMPNSDPETGIRFGVIHESACDPETCELIYNQGVDKNFESYRQELVDAFTFVILKEAKARKLDGMSADLSGIVADLLEELNYGEGYKVEMADATWRLERHGLVLERNDRGYIVVLKSGYCTYVRPCSPCYPNAGDLGSPEEDGLVTYCLPKSWFINNKAPYPVFNVGDRQPVESDEPF